MCFMDPKVLPLLWRPHPVQSMGLIIATYAAGDYTHLQIAVLNFFLMILRS